MADIERYSECERCGSTPLICGMCDHRQRGAEVEQLRAENLKLWARDHARGHRHTSACPVCQKFAATHEEEF